MHPDKVGPYLIDRKIGAGGMGNVYHGVHELTQQEAAIKVLPVAMAREDGFVQRFSREIDALRQLSNRHIVQLYQDGETTDGTFYYAMEFVEGHTLTAEITTSEVPVYLLPLDLLAQEALLARPNTCHRNKRGGKKPVGAVTCIRWVLSCMSC